MEKKIEYYMHLYLGCSCIVDGEEKGTVYGVTRKIEQRRKEKY